MDGVQATQLQSLRAAQQFLDAHGPRLGTINSSGARRCLDERVTRAEQCMADQAALTVAARGETRRYQQRRGTLRTYMTAITRIAQAELAATPNISALSMPRGNPSAAGLVAAARGMAQVAAPHTAIFTAAGLPADFLAELGAATDALQASYDARVRRLGERRSATTGLASQLRHGRQQLPILASFLTSDRSIEATLLADWQASTRIPRRPRHTATPEPLPVTLPPALAALPAPTPILLLTSGAPPVMVEEVRATSLIEALLSPFRRKTG